MGRPRTRLLSINRIVNGALAMLGKSGSFTMTELAAHLNVRQSSLYNHVSGRDQVLDLIRQRMHEEMAVRVDPGGPWQQTIRDVAHAQRAVLARHPFLIPLLATSPAEPGAAASGIENLATVLCRSGFADADVLQIIATIDIIVIGGSLDLVSPEELYPPEVLAGSSDLARVVRSAPIGTSRADAAFEFALDMLVAALSVRLRT